MKDNFWKRKVYIVVMCLCVMKIRLDIRVDAKVEEKFRKRFVRKKGDISKKIEELMLRAIKWTNTFYFQSEFFY